MKSISLWKIPTAMCVCIVLAISGCGKSDHAGEAKSCGTPECEEGEEAASLLSKEDILSARCEHDIFTYKCDECRYEIGVVKIKPELFKKEGSTVGLVETAKVSKRQMQSTIEVTGEIHLNENMATHVNPRIEGIVKFVDVDLGAKVKKNDILFSIDSVELGAAITEYIKYKSLAALSKKNYEREKKLHDSEISSERELIEVQMTYEEHQTNLKAVESKLHVLGLSEKEIATMTAASHDRQSVLLPVRAPIDGTIIKKHVVAGELVGPSSDVMLVADLEIVWAWADIYENDLAALLTRKQDNGALPVDVMVQSFRDRKFPGHIDYIGATMDEVTRTVKVRATLENNNHLLRPGMFCKVRIDMGDAKSVLAIPVSALLSDEGAEFVFTHLQDDLYVRRAITSGETINGFVEVKTGLSDGETIVTDGSFLLKSDILREKMGAGCAD